MLNFNVKLLLLQKSDLFYFYGMTATQFRNSLPSWTPVKREDNKKDFFFFKKS